MLLEWGGLNCRTEALPADVASELCHGTDGHISGGTTFDNTADGVSDEVLAIRVIDLVSSKHASDSSETSLGVFELGGHIIAVIHQLDEISDGDLGACGNTSELRVT